MQIGSMENGLKRKKRRSSSKRRNTTSKAAAKNPSRPVTLARAKAVAAKNGMKIVARGSAANPKRKRSKRRNGLAATPRTRNGFLGTGKSDAEKVLSLGAGAVVTRLLGKTANGFAAPFAAQMGVGKYSLAALQLLIALTVMPFLGTKIRNKAAGDFARLGGLMSFGFSAADVLAPGFIPNPFASGSDIVVGGLVTPAATAAIARGVANSANPQAAAAKVGSAMQSLASGEVRPSAYAGGAPTYSTGMPRMGGGLVT